ncbi:hypothetical protein [Aureivirga marina]|uniref:hypothetical protein n=1 Tax=Aureivirga marina TaxID=1182451 RepID=UPI0018CADF05|nr:hypothetical protein [Aureivirga marina]
MKNTLTHTKYLYEFKAAILISIIIISTISILINLFLGFVLVVASIYGILYFEDNLGYKENSFEINDDYFSLHTKKYYFKDLEYFKINFSNKNHLILKSKEEKLNLLISKKCEDLKASTELFKKIEKHCLDKNVEQKEFFYNFKEFKIFNIIVLITALGSILYSFIFNVNEPYIIFPILFLVVFNYFANPSINLGVDL